MKSRNNSKMIESSGTVQSRSVSNGMNKFFKTSLLILTGIIFFGVSYATTQVAHADTTTITGFTVNGSSAPRHIPAVTVNNGDMLTFAWTTAAPLAPAVNCKLKGGNLGDTGRNYLGSSGGDVVQATIPSSATATQPIEFGLQCFAPHGATDWTNPSSYLTVAVRPVSGTKPVVQVTASPQQLAADGSTQEVVIHWQASNTAAGASCLADGSGGFTGPRGSSGDFTVRPAQAGTYSIACKSPNGEIGYGGVLITTAAPQNAVDAAAAAAGKDPNIDGLKCLTTTGPVPTDIDVGGCIAQAVYYGYYKPMQVIMVAAIYFFDATLSLSISTKFLNRDFVTGLWTILRDFSNMLFIFILIYTGIQTMFGLGSWRKTVINVVVIALLINFSLFFTKVVIDAGNILAVGVYSAMGTTNVNGIKLSSQSDIPERNIAEVVASHFEPQAFLREAGATGIKDPFNAIVIFYVAASIATMVSYVFFRAVLLFLGRVVLFWFLMAISPFALISMVLPKISIFDWWLKNLLGQAFVVPVFLFLLYMIMQMIGMGNGLFEGMLDPANLNSVSDFIFGNLIIPLILGSMISLALNEALKVAIGMSGKMGNAIADAVGKAAGITAAAVITVASGGASLAAGAAGSAALAAGSKSRLMTQSTSAATRARGYTNLWLADKAQKSTFDPRNLGMGIGKKISGLGGLDLGKGNKMTYASQTKAWRKPREDFEKVVADNLEEPESVLRQEQEEAARAKREVLDLDRLLKISEETAKNTQTGKALIDAKQVEENRMKEADIATKKQGEAYDALKKLLDDPTKGEDAMTGKKEGEDEAASAFATAKAAADAAGIAHADAKQVLADATTAHSVTPEAIKLVATKTKKEEAQKIADQKAFDLKTAEAELEKRNTDAREMYASRVERSAFTREGMARARERADKIRKGSPENRKKEAKNKKNLKDLAKIMEEDGARAPAPAPATPPKP